MIKKDINQVLKERKIKSKSFMSRNLKKEKRKS